jgi:hypothetical protein
MGALNPNSLDVAATRDKEVNDMFDGKLSDPLAFLWDNRIPWWLFGPGITWILRLLPSSSRN